MAPGAAPLRHPRVRLQRLDRRAGRAARGRGPLRSTTGTRSSTSSSPAARPSRSATTRSTRRPARSSSCAPERGGAPWRPRTARPCSRSGRSAARPTSPRAGRSPSPPTATGARATPSGGRSCSRRRPPSAPTSGRRTTTWPASPRSTGAADEALDHLEARRLARPEGRRVGRDRRGLRLGPRRPALPRARGVLGSPRTPIRTACNEGPGPVESRSPNERRLCPCSGSSSSWCSCCSSWATSAGDASPGSRSSAAEPSRTGD